MKLFIFLIFAGCAVNCDESGSYYVIERPTEEAVKQPKQFNVYWNVPTFQCKSKNVPFDNLFEKYGIIQNKDDKFEGDKITIMYDPGLFPALVTNKNGSLLIRNGGVPQEGNLDDHLTAFKVSVNKSLPNPEFNGIVIIDFESWRPNYRQNWGELRPYKKLSLVIEKRRHPLWSQKRLEDEAKSRFEKSGREFMQATIALGRLLRPRAKWGYYAFPYCYNFANNIPIETCPGGVQKENDQISWLWTESTVLYPSVYSTKNLTSDQLAKQIRGRVKESARVSQGSPILPYFWIRYRDGGFITEVDLKTALKTMYKSRATGFILWGSSNTDVNTQEHCKNLKKYLEQTLGPEIAKYTKQTYKADDSYYNNETNNTTQNPLDLISSDYKYDENIQSIELDSQELDESNYKNKQSYLYDETSIKKDSSHLTYKKNTLIDIVLSLIENIQQHDKKEVFESKMKRILAEKKKGTPINDAFIEIDDVDSDFSTKGPSKKFRKKAALFTMLYPDQKTTDLNESPFLTEETTTLQSTTVELLYDKQNIKSTATVSTETTVPIIFDKELKYDSALTESITQSTTEDFYGSEGMTETSNTLTEEMTTKIATQETAVKETTTVSMFSTTEATTVVDTVEDDSEYQVVIALE